MNPIYYEPNTLSHRIENFIYWKLRTIIRKLPSNFFGPMLIRLYPVGYICNHQCPMCWRYTISQKERTNFIQERERALTLKEYELIIKSKPLRVETIEIVGGGEPLLYKEILALCTIIKRNHLNGLLITNGGCLNKKIADHLLKIEWNTIRISFHAGTKSTYKTINGVNDFENVCENIKYLVNEKNKNSRWKKIISIGMMFVIQKSNLNDIRSFAHLAEKLKCNYIEYVQFCPTKKELQLDRHDYEKVIIDLATVHSTSTIKNNALDMIQHFRKNENYSADKPSIPNNLISMKSKSKQCVVLNESLLITETGNIVPCCYFFYKPQGNFRQDKSIWKIWRKSSYQQLRRQLNMGIYPGECYRYCHFANYL